MSCALCGNTKETASCYLRLVRKSHKHLVTGYYHPRLDPDELWLLPSGESEVCTNRAKCHARRIAKQTAVQQADNPAK